MGLRGLGHLSLPPRDEEGFIARQQNRAGLGLHGDKARNKQIVVGLGLPLYKRGSDNFVRAVFNGARLSAVPIDSRCITVGLGLFTQKI